MSTDYKPRYSMGQKLFYQHRMLLKEGVIEGIRTCDDSYEYLFKDIKEVWKIEALVFATEEEWNNRKPLQKIIHTTGTFDPIVPLFFKLYQTYKDSFEHYIFGKEDLQDYIASSNPTLELVTRTLKFLKDFHDKDIEKEEIILNPTLDKIRTLGLPATYPMDGHYSVDAQAFIIPNRKGFGSEGGPPAYGVWVPRFSEFFANYNVGTNKNDALRDLVIDLHYYIGEEEYDIPDLIEAILLIPSKFTDKRHLIRFVGVAIIANIFPIHMELVKANRGLGDALIFTDSSLVFGR